MSTGRAHLKEHPKAYRAVLVDKHGDVSYRGPYGTVGAARGQVSSNLGHSYTSFKEGWVEETQLGWTRLGK